MPDLKEILKKIEFFFNHNFREVIILTIAAAIFIGMLGGIVIHCSTRSNIKPPVAEKNTPVISGYSHIDTSTRDFLVQDSFSLPYISNMDVTNDYIDFMPLNSLSKPDVEIIQEELDRLIEDEIINTYKFNFEKRREK